jgi:hypothetical protein
VRNGVELAVSCVINILQLKFWQKLCQTLFQPRFLLIFLRV